MQITYRDGDFLTGGESLIVHGCNAQGRMEAGVALAVRKSLPVAYEVYRSTYLTHGLTLGDVVWAITVGEGTPKIVGNAITQEFYGRSGKRYVDYAAVRRAFRNVDQFVARSQDADSLQIAGVTPITAVGMPMIGAGLGGGDWSEIARIIEEESIHFTPVVYRPIVHGADWTRRDDDLGLSNTG